MKKYLILTLILLAGTFNPVLADKAAVLDELNRPAILIAQQDKLFVLEDTTVLIYRIKDYQLIKKFGRAGEGPGEFKIDLSQGRPMSMSLYQNQILVNSIGKMSYFDMNGKFIREKKVTADALLFPIKNKFIAIGPISSEDGKQFLGFRLFEENFAKYKILYVSDLDLGSRARRLLLPIVTFTYNPVYKDKIYINTSSKQFVVDVYSISGKKLYSIKKDHKPIPTPKNFKQQCLEWFKNSPRFKRAYEMVKQMLEVRDYFPVIRDMQVVDDILHVLTYKRKNELWECLLMDLKGKELGRKFIKMDKYIPFTFYPLLYSSYKAKMYTLVENEDDEQWEVHVSSLK